MINANILNEKSINVNHFCLCRERNLLSEGLYPQSNGSLAIVDVDASKRFVSLWIHLSFANFAIFDLKRQPKLLEMACD